VRRVGCIAALSLVLGGCLVAAVPDWAVGAQRVRSRSDPYCTGSYGGAPAHARPTLRMGIDPGLAGSTGGSQLPTVPDKPRRDLAAVKALAVPGRELVVRLNRLFWSTGQHGINAFRRLVGMYAKAGFEVELQVRYHPPSGKAGDVAAWVRYVRHVVDTFGPDRHVIDMTITNEVNLAISKNTSDGAYPGAERALVAGIEAAHKEALRRGFKQLRFGFTYAYRWNPKSDAAFFSYLRSHGGSRFRRALGFVGLDFYPGTFYPPTMPPGDSYRSELAKAAGVLRGCYLPKARIGRSVPIWITENGVPTGTKSQAQQADALRQLVQAVAAYSGTFHITDYRWFNLRDTTDHGPATRVPLTFSTDGLLLANYRRKESFATYHRLIAALGARGS
jgi:hypothetical protein